MPPFCLIPLIFGDFLPSPLLGLSLLLCLVVSLGVPTLSSETMPSDLPCTVALDVSKFPATASRVDISSAIVRLFSAYKVNAVQFVGNSARVTFSSASDRDAVMRFESVRVGGVDCVVRGVGPRPQKVFVYSYQTGEAMESDSLVNRAVLNASALPVEFVPASVFSSDGFLPVRRRARRKRARIFESTDIGSSDDLGGVGRFSPGSGNVDNCAVNDCDTASCENGETVDIIIGDVNSASNNIVRGDDGNSCVANHSTAGINDNSSDKNISCVFSDNSHTSNVNSSKDGNFSSNSNSSDTVNNCSDNNNNDSCGFLIVITLLAVLQVAAELIMILVVMILLVAVLRVTTLPILLVMIIVVLLVAILTVVMLIVVRMIKMLQLTMLPVVIIVVSLVILPVIQFLMIMFSPTLMIRWI